MKGFKKILGVLFSAVLLCLVNCPSLGNHPFAGKLYTEAADRYTYTVRVYTGVQGEIDVDGFATVNGVAANGRLDETGEYYVIEGLKLQDRVALYQTNVKVPVDENGLPVKYNVNGFRVSGRDNSTANANSSFVVTGDADYVVAYNILNNPVQYVVRYEDAAGNTLREPDVFYGNVGEKPVVAYRYIDNYIPSAYNMTGTLKQDSENVFTFVYTFVPPAEVITTITNVELPGIEIDLGTTVIEGEGGGGPAPGPGGGDGPAPGPGGGDQEEEDFDIPDQPIPEDEGPGDPEELVDIDNPNTPLADPDGTKGDGTGGNGIISIWNGNASQINTPVLIGLIVLIIAVIALGVWGAVKLSKRKKS